MREFNLYGYLSTLRYPASIKTLMMPTEATGIQDENDGFSHAFSLYNVTLTRHNPIPLLEFTAPIRENHADYLTECFIHPQNGEGTLTITLSKRLSASKSYNRTEPGANIIC